MLIETAIIIATLGAPAVPTAMQVPEARRPSYHSVQFFDNLIRITNRVLDRTIRADIVRIHTNLQTGLVEANNAVANQQSVETHCKKRLEATGHNIVLCGDTKSKTDR